ncbi:MAG: c-type cytochrome [Elusimicrobia bacterium]|nr:c-type cytochrome [Elusimicrobiota bacterium]
MKFLKLVKWNIPPMKIIQSTLIMACFTLAACAQKHDTVALGKAYFNGFGCKQCHSVGHDGKLYGPDLTYVGFRKNRQWLELWLKNPHSWKNNTPMPNFHFPDEVRSALVDYLSSLKGQDFKGSPPWNEAAFSQEPIKRGEVIFSRAGCVGCHGIKGVGGYPNNNVVANKIPSLTLVADGYSKEELMERIAKGKRPDKTDPSGPAPMIEMPAWGAVLKTDEIEALAEYLFSLRPPKAAGEEW